MDSNGLHHGGPTFTFDLRIARQSRTLTSPECVVDRQGCSPRQGTQRVQRVATHPYQTLAPR